ncbi:ATP-binding protein [Arthrobacter rhizosphaerae]|uniref:ATP-binding protein n=1 Tax=Arthrobacter rhizosphaerae TaxID=2855490 RepID=UPI001FF49FA4|nr:ATP-binding protein [Arthrobacter rhizosphaerae]
MRAIDLEARVITAVDRIRDKQFVENDLIECKRSWPQENKARQLAGSLNRAGGDPVIYIIGIDDKTGGVHDVSDTDILDWWNQIVAKFEHTPPELIRHIDVQVGEGEHVVALAISSDRAPYVVKTGSANPSLEVPMREGTGTRSARRDELLRLLIPTVRLPEVIVLDVGLRGEYYSQGGTTGTQTLSCTGQLRIYVEHSGNGLITLPAHGMRGRVTIQEQVFDLSIEPPLESISVPAGTKTIGIQRPSDGVSLARPGAVPLQLEVKGLSSDDRLILVSTETMEIEVVLEVLHSVRPLKFATTLSRDRESNMHKPADDVFGATWTPGSWQFKHPGLSFDK